jgi:hypothetical protein
MELREYFETNPDSLPYLERLESEWDQYGKIIIGCDYDDTISPWKMENFNPKRILEVLKVARETGAYIVIFTSCDKARYPEIEDYCKKIGLTIDSINENPIDLPYGKKGKIYANIFLDDRGGMNESLNILEMATYRIRGKRRILGTNV